MSHILVFGVRGQVASALKETFPNAHFLSSSECDFDRPETIVRSLEKIKPSVIINPAAYTMVDAAESEVATARRVNVESPAQIARWCSANGASLIHFSTDYVYPGTGTREWREDDLVGPVNAYGQTKLEGEDAIRASGCHHVILRTSWVFGGLGTNFVRKMIDLGTTRDVLKVIDDQIGSPTYAADLARVTRQVCDHPRFATTDGTFNVTNSGFASWYGFASLIFERLRAQGASLRVERVIPVASAEFPTPAKRPLNSRLSKARLKAEFGIELRPWTAALDDYLGVLRDLKSEAPQRTV